MVRSITLKIKVLKYDPKTEGLGICEEVSHRSFVIEIYDDPTECIFETLAHEMVHIKQYAKRELGDEITLAKGTKEYSVTKWQGKFWKPKKREDSYFDSPWEIEAYGRGIGLHSRWRKKKREAEVKMVSVEIGTQLMLPMDLPEKKK